MKLVTIYLVAVLAVLGAIGLCFLSGTVPAWAQERHLWFYSTLSGGTGGVLYCLRAVYVNGCAHRQWAPHWEPWYYIRPVASLVCGGVSCLILKAGLLLLDASHHPGSNELGFYAFAFVSGLNVDKFISKVEELAQATWGIEKSRAGKLGEKS